MLAQRGKRANSLPSVAQTCALEAASGPTPRRAQLRGVQEARRQRPARGFAKQVLPWIVLLTKRREATAFGLMAYHAIAMRRATLILDSKTVLSDGRVLQRKVWQLPQVEPGRPHGLKYRLYCGLGGRTIVRYDNEVGKGDHRHLGPEEVESNYNFKSLAQLLKDFALDVEQLSGEIK